MSPLTKTLCCLLGLAVAGAPLVLFTAPPAVVAAPVAAGGSAVAGVPALLRCSGQPTAVQLWHEGRLLCELVPQAGLWQGLLELPEPRGAALEIEVQAAWSAECRGAQGLTLELSPAKLPARQDTHWTDPGAPALHDIFTFKW